MKERWKEGEKSIMDENLMESLEFVKENNPERFEKLKGYAEFIKSEIPADLQSSFEKEVVSYFEGGDHVGEGW